MNLISIYYDLSELFNDDVEVVIEAMLQLTHTKYKKNAIRVKLESLCLDTIESELNQLYDMQRATLKAFYLKKTMLNRQTTIYDFL